MDLAAILKMDDDDDAIDVMAAQVLAFALEGKAPEDVSNRELMNAESNLERLSYLLADACKRAARKAATIEQRRVDGIAAALSRSRFDSAFAARARGIA